MGRKELLISLIDKNYGVDINIDTTSSSRNPRQTISFQSGILYKDEYPNIYLNHEITDKEFNIAIDTIITWFKDHSISNINVKLDDRDKELRPCVEMTMEELEKQLGYKVKIVTEKEN